MSDFPIAIPRVSGEFGIPEPYNSNDYRVIKKFICKYLCQVNHIFNRTKFLSLIKNDIYDIGVYPKPEIKNTRKWINDFLSIAHPRLANFTRHFVH